MLLLIIITYIINHCEKCIYGLRIPKLAILFVIKCMHDHNVYTYLQLIYVATLLTCVHSYYGLQMHTAGTMMIKH